ncbi:MAG: hypothetical protein CMB99_02905 [Flavobacteriaceae bacterium]|nr:hypothetical protein [Flavobacteriaceae bacterium]|tara:strand:- start:4006 stop:5019 length:1014 start_codon:yes stop_codon:yes gene_type:complete
MNDNIDNLFTDFEVNEGTQGISEYSKLDNAFQHHGKIRPNKKYSNPSINDIHTLKSDYSLSTADVARFLVRDYNRVSDWFSDSWHERSHNFIPSAAWQSLLEALNIKERMNLTPRYPDIRTEVFETSTRPNKHEFWQLMVMAQISSKKLAELSGVEWAKIKDNKVRGALKFDGFEFAHTVSKRKLHTSPCTFSFDEWIRIRDIITPKKRHHPPKIRAAVTSSTSDYKIYKKDRQRDKINKVKKQANSNQKVEINLKDPSSPFFYSASENYTPPSSYEFIAILTWLGISIRECALIMSCTQKKVEDIIDAKSLPLYYEWRRLLEVFNLVEGRKLNETR